MATVQKSDCPRQPSQQSFWMTGNGKYLIGGGLAYTACVLLGGQMLSSEFRLIIQLGAIMGLMLFIVLGPAHLLAQFLLHLILKLFPAPLRRFEGWILNVPALAVCVFMLFMALMPKTQAQLRSMLQAHLDQPLPASVRVDSYRLQRGMDEGSMAYFLSVPTNAFSEFLRISECSMVTKFEDYAIEPDLPLQIGGRTISPPYKVYAWKTNVGRSETSRLVVVGSNKIDVVFSAAFR